MTVTQPPGISSLAELLAYIEQQRAEVRRAAGGSWQAASTSAASPGVPASIDTLTYLRTTWARLDTDRRLAQSLSTLPDNVGPLHSHYLVHGALASMRHISPAYLDRFVSHLDALLWLEQQAIDARAPPRRVA
jgi:hypothetical protein